MNHPVSFYGKNIAEMTRKELIDVINSQANYIERQKERDRVIKDIKQDISDSWKSRAKRPIIWRLFS